MIYDFHSHTFLSDGALSPVEMVRRAACRGYGAIALTDHVGPGNLGEVLRQILADCTLVTKCWDIQAIPGVELTHVPAAAIAELAAAARRGGARLVVIHGETIIEPVEPGTNRAALECPHVDILAHPGLITPEEAALAARNNIYLEISGRPGHSFTNGHVVQVGRVAGVRFLVNSDAHEPRDLLTEEFARNVALGAGLGPEDLTGVLIGNPQELLRKIRG